MSKNTGLGRGLEALFSFNSNDISSDKAQQAPASQPSKSVSDILEGETAQMISLALIDRNPEQPRKEFNADALNDLANSIKVHGVIQPIIVTPRDKRYMIIAGERRYRAAKIAELTEIPAIVRKYTNQQIKEISLIENLQREDLNPIEAAVAIKQLMEDYNFTQDGVSERIGKSRSAVANMLRLLNLTKEVKDMVINGKLSAGHARCLVVLTDRDQQISVANKAANGKMSVRALEKLVKNLLEPKATKNIERQSVELKELINDMQRVFATKVSVIGNDNKGRIYIDYYSRADLDRMLEFINDAKAKKNL